MYQVPDPEIVTKINRCRCSRKAIFLSDMVTADGKYLEHFVFHPSTETAGSRYNFPRELPTKDDWSAWTTFWRNNTGTGGKLRIPLGFWKNTTHRIWRWYYEKSDDDLQHLSQGKIMHYKPSRSSSWTRSTTIYEMSWSEDCAGKTTRGRPTSVRVISPTKVIKLSEGPHLITPMPEETNFWDFIRSWGGCWMWEDIDTSQEAAKDLEWIAKGLRKNSLVWTTDGSYDRKRAPDLSAVGWIVFCKATGKQLTGTFWEKSPSATSFRAEMLGLACLHILAGGITEYYKIDSWAATISCDNKKALELLSHHQRRIRPIAKCADIRRIFRSIKQSFCGSFHYVHIYGHMDQYLPWAKLSLMQQLNCVCDTLAKRALTQAIIAGYHDRQVQLLPKEDVSLSIWGDKVTGNISTPLQFHAGKEVARFYFLNRTKDKWTNTRFDEIDWEHLDQALKNKPDMYRIWRSKQMSGFCGTRVQVGRYSGDLEPDKRCPNCGSRETAAHLMLCPDEDRTQLLLDSVNELAKWMEKDDKTDPELAFWIPKYILMRGDKPFSEMGRMSPKLQALAASQDHIGWRLFTEGNISTHFYEIQRFHLTMSNNVLNGTDWTKQFISRLLQITHSQWVYRNISLHNKHQGYLRNKQAALLLQEIESLADLSPDEVPETSRFLLEINFTELTRSHIETQKYWVLAVNATILAVRKERARGAKAKRTRARLNRKIPSRTKLGITAVERQIRSDRMHACSDKNWSQDTHLQPTILPFTTKCIHPSAGISLLKSNKRMRKPD
jgi:hypothetical protein